MRYEAAAVPDLRGLAGGFANALAAAGFSFERPTLAAALDGYERWLRKPIRGLEWGESDCAEVITDPVIGRATYTVYMSRHVGELGNQSSVALNLTYDLREVPGLRHPWGKTTEALAEPPALWIAGELRHDPAITAALADDQPHAADLWMNSGSTMERLLWTS
jgi:hypothetical protein